ncbi:MAG: ATP-dependent zinc metalloprotease FtsH [Bifidobacteriaceae bacterium]|jgi:cell division protease FtsH|nr:ATP-dependent zinc metalloprotease FtsH [Bifidobacteriaceae bacterium]
MANSRNQGSLPPTKPQNFNEGQKPPQDNSIWPLILVGLVVASIATFFLYPANVLQIKTSEGLQLLNEHKVTELQVEDGVNKVRMELSVPYTNKDEKTATIVEFFFLYKQGEDVIQTIQKANIPGGYDIRPPQNNWLLNTLVSVALPLLLLFGLMYLFMSKAQNGRGGGFANPFSFGKTRPNVAAKEIPKTRFSDVKGEDEAVEELKEIKDFLTDNKKYLDLGAKIPRGVLLYGPPGTGKTLLARAVAGEAKAPFFSMSGSDFVEMFVGVGASRVRDLFEQAKANAPSIIFLDEIDAVGRHRGSGLGGGHDEREQTLNQLLVEMDGFGSNVNVILIAATNRPDILDPALLRPGRFDRQVPVDIPDLKGRLAILQVHSEGKPLAKDVNLEHVAKRTPGYSGADLANVLNEAALLAARNNKKNITMSEIDESIDRVFAGPQKKTRGVIPEEMRNTAYHEAGHAVVASACNYTDPVTKVTILPRGRMGGYTSIMPSEDRYSVTRNQLLDQLAWAMGGRVAEEVVFHDPTTGASNDIEKASEVARKMVTEYGMTAELGAVKIGSHSDEPFYGRYEESKNYSDETAFAIDREIRKLMEKAHDEAYKMINRNREILDKLAAALLEKETLLEDELKEIFQGIKKAPKRPVWLSSKSRPVSDLPPVPLRKPKT